jgi:hypothetical protein
MSNPITPRTKASAAVNLIFFRPLTWAGREQVGYGDLVTSLEVVLVMAGVPLVIMVVLGLLTLGPRFARARRYRTGQKWNYPPVLCTVDPGALCGGSANHRRIGLAWGDDRGDW